MIWLAMTPNCFLISSRASSSRSPADFVSTRRLLDSHHANHTTPPIRRAQAIQPTPPQLFHYLKGEEVGTAVRLRGQSDEVKSVEIGNEAFHCVGRDGSLFLHVVTAQPHPGRRLFGSGG